jgi:hypothetical protein
LTGRLGPLWHVGMVVPDLSVATTEFARGAGVSFTGVLDRTVVVETGAGTESGRVRWVATSGEQPDWEVIEQRDGGFWSADRNHGAVLHHLAYWSEDMERDTAEYQEAGYTLEASGRDVDGRVRFVYLVSPSGLRLELGARYTQASWDEWVTGGDYALRF